MTSQLRVGFILLLKYLKEKNPNKKEIIINSYNLAEMVNICKNLKDETFNILYDSTIIHSKPLTNALGNEYKKILNKTKVKEIFMRM